MEVFQQKYKQFDVRYHEVSDKWQGFIDQEKIAEGSTLSELKKNLDAFAKKELAFKRVEIFAIDQGEGGFREGTVTSVTDEKRSVWITWKNPRWGSGREKKYNPIFYLMTPGNLDKRRLHESIQAEIDTLKKRQKGILDTMDKFKP